MLNVVGNAVCQSSLEICPDKFIWVKLRRVSREVKGVDSRTTSKESLDELGLVDGASVPEENNGAFEAATKMPEKVSDLSGPNVFIGIKPRVESKSFSFWRDCDGGDSGDFCPTSGDNEGRRSSFDRPSSLDVWNERESALIQEGQAGSKPNGLFLYAAKRDISNSELLFLGAPWLSSAASGSSNPKRSSDSIDSRYSNAPGNSSGRSDQYASRSRGRSNNPLPEVPSPRRALTLSSADPKEAKAVPYSASVSVLCDPSFCSSGANVPRSLKKNSVPGPPNGKCGPVSISALPDAVAFRVFGVCHGVS